MAQGLLARETIADFGEFRAYFRADRDELTFEAFREGDGRAWLLRVPLAATAALAGLLREVAAFFADECSGQDDSGVLREVALGPKDALAAVLLEEGDDRALALWRREQLRTGWEWTIDVLIVPLDLAGKICGSHASGGRARGCPLCLAAHDLLKLSIGRRPLLHVLAVASVRWREVALRRPKLWSLPARATHRTSPTTIMVMI